MPLLRGFQITLYADGQAKYEHNIVTTEDRAKCYFEIASGESLSLRLLVPKEFPRDTPTQSQSKFKTPSTSKSKSNKAQGPIRAGRPVRENVYDHVAYLFVDGVCVHSAALQKGYDHDLLWDKYYDRDENDRVVTRRMMLERAPTTVTLWHTTGQAGVSGASSSESKVGRDNLGEVRVKIFRGTMTGIYVQGRVGSGANGSEERPPAKRPRPSHRIVGCSTEPARLPPRHAEFNFYDEAASPFAEFVFKYGTRPMLVARGIIGGRRWSPSLSPAPSLVLERTSRMSPTLPRPNSGIGSRTCGTFPKPGTTRHRPGHRPQRIVDLTEHVVARECNPNDDTRARQARILVPATSDGAQDAETEPVAVAVDTLRSRPPLGQLDMTPPPHAKVSEWMNGWPIPSLLIPPTLIPPQSQRQSHRQSQRQLQQQPQSQSQMQPQPRPRIDMANSPLFFPPPDDNDPPAPLDPSFRANATSRQALELFPIQAPRFEFPIHPLKADDHFQAVDDLQPAVANLDRFSTLGRPEPHIAVETVSAVNLFDPPGDIPLSQLEITLGPELMAENDAFLRQMGLGYLVDTVPSDRAVGGVHLGGGYGTGETEDNELRTDRGVSLAEPGLESWLELAAQVQSVNAPAGQPVSVSVPLPPTSTCAATLAARETADSGPVQVLDLGDPAHDLPPLSPGVSEALRRLAGYECVPF